jgi:hypothetical protein
MSARWRLLPPPNQEKRQAQRDREGCEGLDIDDLYQILPHRYPFLMIDRILDIQLLAP